MEVVDRNSIGQYTKNRGCFLCGKDGHLARECTRGRPEDRIRKFLELGRLCRVCLNLSQHSAEECRFNHKRNFYKCDICKDPHARTICPRGTRYEDINREEKEWDEEEEEESYESDSSDDFRDFPDMKLVLPVKQVQGGKDKEEPMEIDEMEGKKETFEEEMKKTEEEEKRPGEEEKKTEEEEKEQGEEEKNTEEEEKKEPEGKEEGVQEIIID